MGLLEKVIGAVGSAVPQQCRSVFDHFQDVHPFQCGCCQTVRHGKFYHPSPHLGEIEIEDSQRTVKVKQYGIEWREHGSIPESWRY